MATKVVPGLTSNKRLEILDELRPEKQQAGDVTVNMAMKEWGTKRGRTRLILENAVLDGKLIKIPSVLLDNGKCKTVYRPVKC